MRAQLLWEDLKSSYWFRPSLWVLGLGLVAIFLARVDHYLLATNLNLPLVPREIMGSATGARTMLNAIGTAILTVAALAYSVIMLAVVQTANAYSPRLLDEYLSDTANQHVLGILIGTFLYTLLALREVRSTQELEFVPAIMVTMGMLLAVICVAAFVFFLNHVAHSIEVSSIMWRLKKETMEVIESQRREVGRAWQGVEPPSLPGQPPATVRTAEDGYITTIDLGALFNLACREGLLIRLDIGVGQYAIAGTPLAAIWPVEKLNEATEQALRFTVTLSPQRTTVQDLLYGFQQLSDVAIRALRTMSNDPSTAISCIDVMASLLAEMYRKPSASPYRCDSEGNLRLVAPHPDIAAALDIGFNQIRHYGRQDPACLLRLLDACQQLGYVFTDSYHRSLLWDHVIRTVFVAGQALETPWTRAAVNHHLQLAAEALDEDPSLHLLAIEPLPHQLSSDSTHGALYLTSAPGISHDDPLPRAPRK